MNPEIKKEWVEALRSGEYPQGSGELCNNGSYCCLGVLSEVAVKHGLATKRSVNYSRSFYQSTTSPDLSSTTLIKPLREWSDITEQTTLELLMGMNDVKQLPFSQIASWIEENL